MPDDLVCWVCLDDDGTAGELISMGCGCRRGTGGFAHLECLIQTAAAAQERTGWGTNDHEDDVTPWNSCPTCKLDFNGQEVQIGLARAWVSRTEHHTEEDPERLGAQHCLANALVTNGDSASAEPIYRALLEIDIRRLGAEHRDTLVAAASVALACDAQGKFVEAEKLYRITLETATAGCGSDHELPLMVEAHLCANLLNQDKFAATEQMSRVSLAKWKRVAGDEHECTLRVSTNLATALAGLRRHEEATTLFESSLAIEMRVYGPHHEKTQQTAQSLQNMHMVGRHI